MAYHQSAFQVNHQESLSHPDETAVLRIAILSPRTDFIQRISSTLEAFGPDFLIPVFDTNGPISVGQETGLAIIDGNDVGQALELARRIRDSNLNPRVPILVIGNTTHSDELIRPISRLGQAEFLHEPLDSVVLREKAINYLELAHLKQAHARLQKECVLLKESNDELEKYAYLTAHDLQEPLRGLLSYLQLLRERTVTMLDVRTHGYLNRIVATAENMRTLVLSALEFAKSSSLGIEPSRCDAALIVKDALELLEPKIQMANAVSSVGPMPWIVADRAQIQRIFQNLICNGLKYNDSKPPTIAITARDDDGYWIFSVTDNGIGVPESERDRIFQLFQRGHDGKFFSGCGIGLTICRKIVEHHQGRIWVEPSTEHGSTFSFSLQKNHA